MSNEATRPTDREIDRVLWWAEGYIGCGIAHGLYEHTCVPAEQALAYISSMRARLQGKPADLDKAVAALLELPDQTGYSEA